MEVVPLNRKHASFGESSPVDAPLSVRIFALLVIGLILFMMRSAKKRELQIRRIPGIDAMEEALGRATEMGKPVLFVPGIGGLDNMQTFAGLSVLKWIAKKCEAFSAKIIVPILNAAVVAPAAEMVANANAEVRFVSQDQGAFSAGVIGSLAREQVATAFYFGSFGFESLLIAESGRRQGVLQIAATADYLQIPFFMCTCDYTLIGEELYAAGAYLSRDPVEIGTIRGQDFAKLIIAGLIIIGSVFAYLYSGSLNPVEGLLGR